MKIAFGNDHGGFELKEKIIAALEKEGTHTIVDMGCHSTDIVRYPYYAAKVAAAVQSGEADRGVLICSTGIGMSITANKYKGIRAALVYSSYQAKMTAAHNSSNIICLGGRCIGDFEAIDFINLWLNTEYEGGRHAISLDLISNMEEENFNGGTWNPGIPEDQ